MPTPVSRMRQHEAGEAGLEQASAEVTALRRQVRTKERRVEELIGQADSLQLQVLLALPTTRCRSARSPRRTGS